MATLPATGYIENASRTVAEIKAAIEAVRDKVSTGLGGAARAELTIASGTVTPATRDHGGFFTLDTEGDASTDDLDTITYTNLPDGSVIAVGAENASRVVTLKDANGGAGEMLMADSADFVLDALDKWVIFQRRGTSWVEIDRSYGVDHNGLRAYHEIPQLTGGNVLAPHENLVVKYVTAATVDIDADALLVTDTNGNQLRLTSVDITVDISTTGANGRNSTENAGAERASDWYHLWVIYNPSTATAAGWATLNDFPGSGSSVFTDAPSGYTYAAYVGAAYNDSGSDLDWFLQNGVEAISEQAVVFTATGDNTTRQSQSIAAFVPDTARGILGYAESWHDSSGNAGGYMLPTDNDDRGAIYFTNSGGGSSVGSHPIRMMLNPAAPHTIYYVSDFSTHNLRFSCSGWTYGA